ncbi:MAG: SNF2-related protein [Bacteroidales bacterium]
MNKEFIIGIAEDKKLGFIARAFIIQQTPGKSYYPIEVQLNELTFPKYSGMLSGTETEIYEIVSEFSDNNIYKIFKTKKDKTLKEFFDRLTKEEADKKIKPFIERKLAKLTDALRESDTEVYFKEKHKFINRDDKIFIEKTPAKTVFNIIKEENNTRYFLSINQNDDEIKLTNKSFVVLSNDPCRIIIDNHLYSFEDIDSKKLLPFFEKEYIEVDKKNEKKWYQLFALPNIKKFKVNPKGFEINKIKPSKKALLSLENDLAGKPALVLKFGYGNHFFLARQGQEVKVDMDTRGESYKFIKIERDKEWEEAKINMLKSLGLKISHLSFFGLTSKNSKPSDEDIYDLLYWLKKNHENLSEEGFAIQQKFFEKTYNFSSCHLSINTHDYNDWFDIRAVVEINGYTFPFVKLKKYILNNIREIKLPDGTYGIIPREWFEKFTDLFKYGEIRDGDLWIRKHHFKVIEDSFERSQNYPEALQNLIKDIQSGKIKTPPALDSILRNYQKEGYRWMYVLHKHNLGGCLADDMGLGKTIQTLALLLQIKNDVREIEINYRQKPKQKHQQLNLFSSPESDSSTKETTTKISPTFLIVMPTSLIYNWANEIRKFSPELSVYKYTGLNRTNSVEKLYQYDIILTTYGIVRNDSHFLQNAQFYYIVLDESQYIKNPSSKIFKAVNQLNGKHKLVLTGTPIENSLSDLWAQLHFLNKGLLGTYNFFKNEFLTPVEKHNNKQKQEKLKTIIQPFILRRTKHDVAKELPEKTEQTIYCDMPEEQRRYYDSEKSKIRNNILEYMENPEEQASLHILDGLSKLRQAANHPVMIDENYEGDSGKFTEIKDYLESLISEGHKVLVFSSYKKHLKLIQNFLQSANIQFSLLTGETQNRQRIVNEFQQNPENKVFLIQIKAGGSGLNLTAADYVMIIDPWWNPAVEEQAINRAHRIGQDKKVVVYRFITVETVEEKIQTLQNKKGRLADSFIETSDTLRNLSKEQIMELFK